MSVNFDFSNKTVVVIGGTSGINLGIAECFAKNGARVAVASRNIDRVNTTVESLKKLSGEAMGFSADVRNQDDLIAGMNKVFEHYGSFDVVISGAAGNFPALVNNMSANAFKSVIDIDLLGTFHVMQAAYPHLTKPGASLINISAPQAFLPMIAQAQAHVCSAKAGVDMITRTLAMEWGPEGIRINSIVPGPIENTEGMKRLAPSPELIQEAIKSVPLKRLGKAEEIGNMCMFLASEQAEYVNGAIIPVDGGWSLAGASGLSVSLGEIFRAMSKNKTTN